LWLFVSVLFLSVVVTKPIVPARAAAATLKHGRAAISLFLERLPFYKFPQTPYSWLWDGKRRGENRGNKTDWEMKGVER